MHTLEKETLTQDNFETPIPEAFLKTINETLELNRSGEEIVGIDKIKNIIPDGFLQRRIVAANYKTIRNIITQRKSHRLPQWRLFCNEIVSQLKFSHFVGE
jgi:hypothetical protein